MGNSLSEMKESYDWKEAFVYAPFDLSEVAAIIKADEGFNDGDRWLAVGVLNDGRFFFLSAGCDYTGWDCQAWGDCEFADTLDDLVRWRLGDHDRERLGFELPAETDGAPLPIIAEGEE